MLVLTEKPLYFHKKLSGDITQQVILAENIRCKIWMGKKKENGGGEHFKGPVAGQQGKQSRRKEIVSSRNLQQHRHTNVNQREM